MKSKNKTSLSAYDRAKKRVDRIKGFYGHLAAYVIVNIIVLLSRAKFLTVNKEVLGNPEFLNWLDWNTYGTPIIWGIGLIVHAVSVFSKNPFLGRKWEERQIQKYMDEGE